MLIESLRQLWVAGSLNGGRLAIRLTGLVGLLVGPLFWIPAEFSWTQPGIVQYSPPAIIRAQSPGFVQHIHVGDGQAVKQGEPIVTLENDDLRLKLSDLRKQHRQVQQEIQSARWRRESSELADAQTREMGLGEQVRQVQADVDALVLRSPVDGIVVSRSLGWIEGTFVDIGEELAVVGTEDSKRLKVSVNQYSARDEDRWKGQRAGLLSTEFHRGPNASLALKLAPIQPLPILRCWQSMEARWRSLSNRKKR
ncbi:MAG: efflux RND transporter periplasmic adaptor subunit [Pirellulaceae bacterium]